MAIRSDNTHMESPVRDATTERRSWRRQRAPECPWLRTFRLYPGRGAELVDLSRGGALVESRDRFVPGTWLQMKIATDSELLWSRAQVVRCEVVRLSTDLGTTYRTAVGFEHALALRSLSLGDGYSVPGPLPKMVGDSGSGYPEPA